MRKGLIGALVLALLVSLGWGWRLGERATKAENTLGLDSTRVVADYFRKAKSLKVYTVGGSVVANLRDDGFMGILPSAQKTKLPFTADYFVDFAKLGNQSYLWDEKHRTITVDLPDVIVAAPNIDATKAETVQSGVFITRGAGLRLHQATAQAVAVRARDFARQPENLLKARNSAREAVASLTAAPLQAAGLEAVRVVVRFPFDARGSTERWDESRPLAEVVADKDGQK